MFHAPQSTDLDRSFLLPVVGERYDNADGSSRQDEIRCCRPGERVWLEREPANRFDPSAVAVFSLRGQQIGYIGANRCGWVGSKIERGMDVLAQVERIIGDPEESDPCRLVIRITFFGESD